LAKPDAVNPSHYRSRKLQPIDIIHEYGLGFDLGNTIKYILRHEQKNGREDLLKATWYLLHHLGMSKERIKGITNELEGLDAETIDECATTDPELLTSASTSSSEGRPYTGLTAESMADILQKLRAK
jgi:hypothetical protein